MSSSESNSNSVGLEIPPAPLKALGSARLEGMFSRNCKKQSFRTIVSSVGYFLIVLSFRVNGQSELDSLVIGGTKFEKAEFDLIDSVSKSSKQNWLSDSISLSSWSAELKLKIESRFSDDRIAKSRDSLEKLGLSKPFIANHGDSLIHQRESLLSEVAQRHSEIQRRVSSRYIGWTAALRKRFNLDSAVVQPPGLSIQSLALLPPDSERSPLPKTNAPEVAKMTFLESSDFTSLALSPELTSVGGDLAIPSTEQLSEWKRALPAVPNPTGIVKGELGTFKSITKDPVTAAEKALTNNSTLKEATNEIKEVEQLKTNNEALKSAEQLKDPKVSLTDQKNQAINHFIGNEAVLQGAMSQMAKYKKKYHSVGSLSEIKKDNWLPKNGLKGKPFKERFRPGLNLGFRGGDTLLFDFYPNAAYRITGRIEAGLGAIYRVRVVQKPFGIDQREPVWGMNSFVVVKTFKSFFLRFEVDGNSFPVSASFERPSYRDWRWSFYSGIQTNFKISKRFIGNALMMYGFDKSLKDGFPERLQARVGMQYKLVKGKR